MNIVPEGHSLPEQPVAPNHKGASSNGPLPHPRISTPTVTVTEIEEEGKETRHAIAEHADIAASKNGSLTPSGPPESHQQFSMQDFKRSFYHHYLKDRTIEKSNPYGFSSANASRDHSRSQSPSPCTYAEALKRRGSLGGSTQ